MTASERISIIRSISTKLGKENYALIDLTLKEFNLPYTNNWQGSGTDNYIIDMISEASDEALLNIAKHLGLANELQNTVVPSFWSPNEVRIFISHIVEIKDKTSKLSKEIEKYHIKTFVAHVDIEPSKEWLEEIETALSTMDGMIAIFSDNFINSKWCDQEVGYAIGRRVPIVPLKIEKDPHGFAGKYQALPIKGKPHSEIANEIFQIILKNPVVGLKLTSVLIRKLKTSQSWSETKNLLSLIELSKYITEDHISLLKEAINENSQVKEAWGVPERILELESRLKS